MTARRARALAVAAAVLGLAARAAADPLPVPSPSAPSASVPSPSTPPASSTLDVPVEVPDLVHFIHLESSSTVSTDGGSTVHLPPGFFLDEERWGRLDAEMRRLQNQETRLTAENKSLNASMSGWQPGWKSILGIALSGIALGWYVHGL